MKNIIAIDMCYFRSIHTGGKDEVAYNLLRGFESMGIGKEIICFCYKELVPVIRKANQNVRIFTVPRLIRPRKFRIVFDYLIILISSFYKEWVAKRNHVKLFIFPSKPSPARKLFIPTIEIPHDIQVFINNNVSGMSFDDKSDIIYQYEKHTIKNDFKYRDHIIAISCYDQNEMISHMPWAVEKITQIYDPIRFPNHSTTITYEKKYITALNIQHSHKNVISIIKAFSKIADEIKFDLILVGKKPENIHVLEKYINENALNERIIFTGFVSDEELDRIIHETRLYP